MSGDNGVQFPSGTHIFSLSHARVVLINPSFNTMHVSANLCRLHCFHFASLTRAFTLTRALINTCPFSTVFFLQCISSYDVLCPGEGGTHSNVKRMGVSSENFEKTPKRYQDLVLWPWLDIVFTSKKYQY